LEQQHFQVQQQDVDQEHQQLQMKYGFSDKVRTAATAAAANYRSCQLVYRFTGEIPGRPTALNRRWVELVKMYTFTCVHLHMRPAR
jgi:hypothetical protein